MARQKRGVHHVIRFTVYHGRRFRPGREIQHAE